jgi:predicted amidophosphoribosyltransferase
MARQRRVLLVDDVMTTGTTLVRAREALLAAGALDVRCAVIARVR